MPAISEHPEWLALKLWRERNAGVSLRDYFRLQPERGTTMSASGAGLYLDYSRQRIGPEGIALLLALAAASRLHERIEAMFAGAVVNASENRPALHTALRLPRAAELRVGGTDVVAEVHAVLARMRSFSEAVRSGAWRGHDGQPIRHVVNIGIGGSQLGPEMACLALRDPAATEPVPRFIANVDPDEFHAATHDLDPGQTLFVICSKSFATHETMVNATAARRWCLDALGDEAAVARHFVAVSANAGRVAEFGIDPAALFPMPDWVGGRYSLDSAVGLALMLAIGSEAFDDLLAGFHAMDLHFRSTPFGHNLPVLLGLLAIWNNNFLGAETQAILPYSRRLGRFPAYLQQLVMESNGKHVRSDGTPAEVATAPICWGEPGTNGQHSFHQLLLQGTRLVPCDFIGFLEAAHPRGRQQDILLANMIGQAEALALGRNAEELRAAGVPEELVPHRVCPGNQPSSTILAERLDPRTLGALVALYEHAVFVQGAIWGINSFDQWGVELGKQLAERSLAAIEASTPSADTALDSSTRELIRRCREARGRQPLQ